MALVYKKNEKHKRGAVGQGPPRWFPSNASFCPDDHDLPLKVAQELLESSVEGRSPEHADARARYAYQGGVYYKGYPEGVDGDNELWHGYPVRRDQVPKEIPSRILREFRNRQLISSAEYRKLLGSAR